MTITMLLMNTLESAERGLPRTKRSLTGRRRMNPKRPARVR